MSILKAIVVCASVIVIGWVSIIAIQQIKSILQGI